MTAVTVETLVDGRGIIRLFEFRLPVETTTGNRIQQRVVWTVTMVDVVDI